MTAVPARRQALEPGAALPRHRHAGAYAAVVLAGGYEEAGDAGRRRVGPGEVVLHGAFEAHLDRTGVRGAQVLNLPLDRLPGFRFGVVADVDALARAAERDGAQAAAMLLEMAAPSAATALDWPDLLAADLLETDARLDAWAVRRRLAPETVSRGFRRVFGVAPARYRLEARTRRALALVRAGGAGLAMIAAETGFADQAHMTRAIRELTGKAPGAWRA